MQDTLLKFTHIGRIVDPQYPTNRAIMLWSILASVAVFVMRMIEGLEVGTAMYQTVYVAITVFLTWALTREVDPEEPLSAFMATALITVALIAFMPEVNLLALPYLMFVIRIINRTIGLPAKWTDSLVILGFTASIAFVSSWVYALPGVIAFLLDALLPEADRKQFLFAGASLVVVVFAYINQAGETALTLPSIEVMIALGLATLIFFPTILRSRQLTVGCDVPASTLYPQRVQAGQLFTLLYCAHIALWNGDAGVVEMLPVWLIFVGVAVFPLVKPMLPKSA